MLTYEFEEQIRAEPQVVFDYLTDQERIPTWSPEVVRSEHVGGGEIQVGSQLRQTRRQGKREMTSVVDVVEHEPPGAHGVRARVLGVEANFVFRLRPAAGGSTHITLSATVEGRGLGRLLEKKLGNMMKAADAPALGRLKSCVEQAGG